MNADMNANMSYGGDKLCSPRNHQGCGFAENETSRVTYKFCQVDVEPLNKFERGRKIVGMVLAGDMPAQGVDPPGTYCMCGISVMKKRRMVPVGGQPEFPGAPTSGSLDRWLVPPHGVERGKFCTLLVLGVPRFREAGVGLAMLICVGGQLLP